LLVFGRFSNRGKRVAFSWIQGWDDAHENRAADDTKYVRETFLITAHANGDICIWKICANQPSEPKKVTYSLKLEYKRKLFPGETVSCIKYVKVSSTLGGDCRIINSLLFYRV